MIATWVMVGIVAIIAILIVIAFIFGASDCETTGGTIGCIIGAIVTIAIAVAICFGMLWYLYNTESGERAIKDWQSNITGGIERTVTVYDMEGDVIAVYSGKFDVESNDTRIKFDDEDGKRHIIYFTTGTVTIDED